MGSGGNAALVKADALAAAVLSRIGALRFGVARLPGEIEAVYRLRFAVVMDQGWGRAEDFPDGLEFDPFDHRAIQVAAWDGDELVGTTRLVEPSEDARLPTEQAFDLPIARCGSVIDMGRTCRAPWRREAGPGIVRGLICRAWIELRARGYSEVCGIFSPAMVRFYRRLGLRAEILGGPRPHWGEVRHPILVRPGACVDDLRLE